jgi:hypothetical protein
MMNPCRHEADDSWGEEEERREDLTRSGREKCDNPARRWEMLPGIAWLKAHVAIDKLFKIGKGGYEVAEARSKAIAAASEARQATRREQLANLELRMHLLDGQIKMEHNFCTRIFDPKVYAERLNAPLDLVLEVMIKRGDDMALTRALTSNRLKNKWS